MKNIADMEIRTLSPIAVFVYKRASHTKRMLDALAQNPLFSESQVHIFSDGPRTNSDESAVREVRELVKSYKHDHLTVIEREYNFGLKKSITEGVAQILKTNDTIIVLEDDTVVSKNFLEYMNEALAKYRNADRVMQISGFMYDVEVANEFDALFLPFISTWGWATWRRAWEKLIQDAAPEYERLRRDRSERRRFNLNDSYPYFKMLSKQLEGKIQSWGILWNLTVFRNHGLVLYPNHSLVNNVGFDGTGTHHETRSMAAMKAYDVARYPVDLEIDEKNYTSVCRLLKRENSVVNKILRRSSFYLKKIFGGDK